MKDDVASAPEANELTQARETIRRLNRRVQSAESGLAEKINENAGRSLGRAFANAAATMYSAQLVEANETISRQLAELALLRNLQLTLEEAEALQWCVDVATEGRVDRTAPKFQGIDARLSRLATRDKPNG